MAEGWVILSGGEGGSFWAEGRIGHFEWRAGLFWAESGTGHFEWRAGWVILGRGIGRFEWSGGVAHTLHLPSPDQVLLHPCLALSAWNRSCR